MRLSSSGHAYFLREQDIDSDDKDEIRKKCDIDIEVEAKKRDNEIKLENNFDIDLGFENNRNISINGSMENEEKSPPNTPISSQLNLDKLQINDECKKMKYNY